MHTTINPEGTVTVTAAGHHRMSELQDAAALAFATELETAVPWPTLVRSTEIDENTFAATYALVS